MDKHQHVHVYLDEHDIIFDKQLSRTTTIRPWVCILNDDFNDDDIFIYINTSSKRRYPDPEEPEYANGCCTTQTKEKAKA